MPKQCITDKKPLTRHQSNLAGKILKARFDPKKKAKQFSSVKHETEIVQLINRTFEDSNLEPIYSTTKLNAWVANALYRHRCKMRNTPPNSWVGIKNGGHRRSRAQTRPTVENEKLESPVASPAVDNFSSTPDRTAAAADAAIVDAWHASDVWHASNSATPTYDDSMVAHDDLIAAQMQLLPQLTGHPSSAAMTNSAELALLEEDHLARVDADMARLSTWLSDLDLSALNDSLQHTSSGSSSASSGKCPSPTPSLAFSLALSWELDGWEHNQPVSAEAA